MKNSPRLALYHTAPYTVTVVEETCPHPGAGEVLARTLLSGISPGTESLLYRGQFPHDQPLDDSIPALSDQFSYPLKYGYSSVAEVIGTGSGVKPDWLGRKIFAFNPHESRFCGGIDHVHLLPEHISPENAIFLPNMETALNLVMDGRPIVGERVLVLGQGILGLLTTGILSQFPLESLVTVDRYPIRREASLELGASESLDPEKGITRQRIKDLFPDGADLTFELSGSPETLDRAIEYTGFDGRVVIGSWYGSKRSPLNLGGAFHRSRIRLISSQVSTIAPGYTGRWTKERRFLAAWEMVRQLNPSRFITHRFFISDAQDAFHLLDEQPQDSIQVVFKYD
jgi:2-desacetyl-2-hydroxyethyl bacteriochlorophyllide A dehydrogenase